MRGVNHYLVELETPLTEKIKTESGVEFYLAPEFNFSWNVTVTGRVVLCPENKARSLEHIKVDDKVAISYQVVNQRKFTGDSHIFKLESHHPNIMIYYNGKGEHLRVTKIPDHIKKGAWVGVYIDKRHILLDGCEGTESDLNRWLAQFPMSNSKDFVFQNLVRVNDKYYWKVEKEQILAKKLKNRLFATSNYAICKPIVIDLSKRLSLVKGIHLAPNSVLATYPDRAKLISGGKEYGLNVGDEIGFDRQYVNKYMLFDEEYYLIKENRILCTWN